MKTNKRRLMNMIVVFGMLILTIVIIFQNNDLETVLHTFSTLNPLWLLAAIGCWIAHIFFDGLGFHYHLRRHGYPVSLGYAFYVSLMGSYYSGITPGSSGGQPMQIYYLKKRNVPIGVSTSAISTKFVLGQLSTVVLVPIIWLFNHDFLNQQLAGVQWLVVAGWIVHLVGVVLVLMVSFCRPLVQRIADWLIRIGTKLRLVRNPENAAAKLTGFIDSYHASILTVGRHPKELFAHTLLAVINLFMLMSIIICVYHAFGISGTPWYHLLTVAYMLYLSASYNPLPGASGAQEGGFLVFYRGIFASGQISLAMLVWRFISYYLSLIVGASVSVLSSFRNVSVNDSSGNTLTAPDR